MKSIKILILFLFCSALQALYAQSISLGNDTTYCSSTFNAEEIGIPFQTNLSKNLKVIGFSTSSGTSFEWSIKPKVLVSGGINTTITTSDLIFVTTIPNCFITIKDSYANIWFNVKLKITENNVSYTDSMYVRLSRIKKYKYKYGLNLPRTYNIRYGDSLQLTIDDANISGGVPPTTVQFVTLISTFPNVQFVTPIWLNPSNTLPTWCKPVSITLNDTTSGYFARLTDSLGCSAESFSLTINAKRNLTNINIDSIKQFNPAIITSEGDIIFNDNLNNEKEVTLYDINGIEIFRKKSFSHILKLPSFESNKLIFVTIKYENSIQTLKYISK